MLANAAYPQGKQGVGRLGMRAQGRAAGFGRRPAGQLNAEVGHLEQIVAPLQRTHQIQQRLPIGQEVAQQEVHPLAGMYGEHVGLTNQGAKLLLDAPDQRRQPKVLKHHQIVGASSESIDQFIEQALAMGGSIALKPNVQQISVYALGAQLAGGPSEGHVSEEVRAGLGVQVDEGHPRRDDSRQVGRQAQLLPHLPSYLTLWPAVAAPQLLP